MAGVLPEADEKLDLDLVQTLLEIGAEEVKKLVKRSKVFKTLCPFSIFYEMTK